MRTKFLIALLLISMIVVSGCGKEKKPSTPLGDGEEPIYEPPPEKEDKEEVLDPSLVAYWSLDNGEAKDSVSNFDGVVYGATAIDEKALHFDGSDYIEIPSFSFSGNEITLELLIRPDIATSQEAYLIHGLKNTEGNQLWLIYYPENQNYNGVAFNPVGEAGKHVSTSESDLYTAEWYHIVAVYDASSIKLYRNSELVGERTASGNIKEINKLRIGAVDKKLGLFKGYLDEIKIYSKALNEAEIKAKSSTALSLASSIDFYKTRELDATAPEQDETPSTPTGEYSYTIQNPGGDCYEVDAYTIRFNCVCKYYKTGKEVARLEMEIDKPYKQVSPICNLDLCNWAYKKEIEDFEFPMIKTGPIKVDDTDDYIQTYADALCPGD